MSLFEGLSIGKKALAASQIALNVTGQNISNANTEGYSRKRASLVSDYRLDDAYGQMGFGVDAKFIERVRNIFIDRQMVSQVAEEGYLTTIDAGLESLENVYQEPSDTGLAQSMDDFWNAWSDVANNPNDKSSREALKSTAEVLTERFKYTADQIDMQRLDINDQIENTVSKINDYAKRISDLNVAVTSAEAASTDKANDSRDQRDQLLKELGALTAISYIEDASGAVTVTASGSMLVSPQKAYELETFRDNIYDPSGGSQAFYGVRFQYSNTDFKPKNGELKALFDLRDDILPKYLEELDLMAATLVENVNSKHVNGYTLNKLTGVNFFDTDKLTAGTISLSAAVQVDSNNIAAGVGGTLIPLIGVVGTTDATGVVDLTTVDPAYRNLAQGTLQIVDPLSGRTLIEGTGNDYVVDYDLGRIMILDTATYPLGSTFNVDFTYNSNGYSGDGDGNNALLIAGLRDVSIMDPDVNTNNTHTLAEYYAGHIGRLGVERNEAASQLETQASLVEQLKNVQDSISGVNLDEEMGNLIKFQQTYKASANFLTTVKDMMDVLMSI